MVHLSLVTTDAAAAPAILQITADGTVDIDSAGVLTLDSGAAINIEPAAGSAILLDGTISIDAGVVTGATSVTSTAFVGALTGAASSNLLKAGGTMTGVLTINHTNDAQLSLTSPSSWTGIAFNEEGTGALLIKTNGTGVNIQKGDSENIAEFLVDGAVKLYHNNVNKLETTCYWSSGYISN